MVQRIPCRHFLRWGDFLSNDFISGFPNLKYFPIKSTTTAKPLVGQSSDFAQLLQTAESKVTPLVLSQHAASRMQQRGVRLSDTDWDRLGVAVTHVAAKGARDAYVMYGDVGFVVNVPNRIVVTAMTTQQEETIVTNVDSVVVLPRLDR